MVDLFEQVEEELRVEQYKRLASRIMPWALGLVVGLLIAGGGYIGWTKWQEHASAQAAETYEAAMRANTTGDEEGAFKQFGQVAAKGPGGYKALALMHQGGIRLDQGNAKEAARLFDAAAKAAPSGAAGDLIEDTARLKSALALLDDAPYADLEARLKPLIAEDRPFRALAREALAIAKLNAGKTKEARQDFLVLSAALDGGPDAAQRARAAVDMIDSGAAATLPAAIKQAKAAPPPMQIPAELLQQLQAQGINIQGAPGK